MSSGKLHQLASKAKERGCPFRILIVDDEPWIRDVFRNFCTVTGVFEVDLAVDGSDALKKISDNDYDLVTMDLIMPELSGLDAVMEIKRVAPSLPIMIITGNATDRLVTEAGIEGACCVMYKPVQLEDFVEELAATLVR